MTGPRPHVVLPLDGSTEALAALPIAREIARLERGLLEVVHVAGESEPARTLLEHLRVDPLRVDPGTVVLSLSGAPADRILEAAERDDATIVLASSGPEGLGPVARQVVRGATRPVVVVKPSRGETEWPLKTVLFAYDGSPGSRAVLGPASRLAEHAGGDLFALYVSSACESKDEGTLAAPRYVDAPQHEWPAWADEALERLSGLSAHAPVKLRFSLARGDAAGEIVRFARQRGIDLLALTWRGSFDSDRARVVKAVLRDAPCPVILQRSS